MDSCHLTGSETGCLTDIIQPMAGGEMLLDTFSVDAQNESHDVWHFALSCDKKALNRSAEHSFCGDRLKGQDSVNDYVYPELDFTNCHFHIKENIKGKGGGQCEFNLFQELAYSKTDVVRKKYLNRYMRTKSKSQVCKIYFKNSIMPDKDKCDVFNMPGENEGLFSCQLSESFHKVMRKYNVRMSPISNIPELIIKYEHNKILQLQDKYQKLMLRNKNQVISSSLENIINRRIQPATNYEIEVLASDPLSAKVTSKYETLRFTHLVTLSVKPPT